MTKAKNDKRIFEIGQHVFVKNEVKLIREVDTYFKETNRVLKKSSVLIGGVIIGATYRFTGKIVIDNEYGNYFLQDGSVLVWQVKTGYLNRPIEALAEDISTLEEILDIPWKYDDSWTVEARANMSAESAGWPRDSKGRFSK